MNIHQDNLINSGYSIFTEINNPVDTSQFPKINELFQKCTISNGTPRKYAYNTTFSCYLVTTEAKRYYTDFRVPTIDFNIDYILETLLYPIINIIPGGPINTKKFIILVFIDDTRGIIEDNEESVRKQEDPTICFYRSRSLAWHKDVFPGVKYRWLYFTVTYLHGIEEHQLELGYTDKNNLFYTGTEAFKAKDEDVTLLKSFPSIPGNGYLCDHDYDVLHRCTEFSTYISNFDIANCDYINNEDITNYKKLTNNNVKDKDYKTPKRYKIVIRISDDLPLNCVFEQ